MKVLGIIEGVSVRENDDGTVSFTAGARIDTDGSGPLHGDPCAQRDTTLHFEGKALNADVDRYIVTPPLIIHGVKGIVMGCQAHVRNIKNGKETYAVVGDIGPSRKIGEVSVATAAALGINPSPTKGGTDEHIVEYVLWPNKAASVDGKHYSLQPAH